MQNLRHRSEIAHFFNVMLDENLSDNPTDEELQQLDEDLKEAGSEVSVADIDQAIQDGLEQGHSYADQRKALSETLEKHDQ